MAERIPCHAERHVSARERTQRKIDEDGAEDAGSERFAACARGSLTPISMRIFSRATAANFAEWA
jgi:hypothetical protein